MIYFIQAAEKQGPIKIGRAIDPHKRLKALQNTSPVRLCILGIMKGDREEERVLHIEFSKLRLWGEWFRPSDDLLAFIKEKTDCPFDDPRSIKTAKTKPKTEPKIIPKTKRNSKKQLPVYTRWSDVPENMTVDDIAAIMRVGPKAIKTWPKRAGLPAKEVNGKLVIKKVDFCEWLEQSQYIP